MFCTHKVEVTPSFFIKLEDQSIMIFLETLITNVETFDDSACELHCTSSKIAKL